MTRDSYYSAPTSTFVTSSNDAILGELTRAHHHALEHQKRDAWWAQLDFLKAVLRDHQNGYLFLEFSIPRMGKRADAVLLLDGVVYVIEFKVHAKAFDGYAIDQVHNYALDLKNFYLGSHGLPIVPVLCATEAPEQSLGEIVWAEDAVCQPVLVGRSGLQHALRIKSATYGTDYVDVNWWRTAGYRPTPTIIEAAEALYRSHAVEEISRSDAGAKNLLSTSDKIAEIIDQSKRTSRKSICFITGVPGAGKTLAGLNIAAKRTERHEDEHAVFLSGNGPLPLLHRPSRLGTRLSKVRRLARRDAHLPVVPQCDVRGEP